MATGPDLEAPSLMGEDAPADPVARLMLAVDHVIRQTITHEPNVLEVELDFFSQFAALWVYIAYLVTGLRERSSSLAFAFAAIGVTAAVLALYAL